MGHASVGTQPGDPSVSPLHLPLPAGLGRWQNGVWPRASNGYYPNLSRTSVSTTLLKEVSGRGTGKGESWKSSHASRCSGTACAAIRALTIYPSPRGLLSPATRPKKKKKISRGLGSSCEENQGRITSSQMLLGSELLELALSAGYIQVIQYRDGSVPGRNCTPEDWALASVAGRVFP